MPSCKVTTDAMRCRGRGSSADPLTSRHLTPFCSTTAELHQKHGMDCTTIRRVNIIPWQLHALFLCMCFFFFISSLSPEGSARCLEHCHNVSCGAFIWLFFVFPICLLLQNNCLLIAADNIFFFFFFAADGCVSVKNFFIIMFSSGLTSN